MQLDSKQVCVYICRALVSNFFTFIRIVNLIVVWQIKLAPLSRNMIAFKTLLALDPAENSTKDFFQWYKIWFFRVGYFEFIFVAPLFDMP